MRLQVSNFIGFQVRVPLADATAVKAPEGIADNALVLMADIFPTGYFAANNAFKDMTQEQIAEATVVVIGCGYIAHCIHHGKVLIFLL